MIVILFAIDQLCALCIFVCSSSDLTSEELKQNEKEENAKEKAACVERFPSIMLLVLGAVSVLQNTILQIMRWLWDRHVCVAESCYVYMCPLFAV